MSAIHSNSLVLVWQVAQFEARYLKATALGPTHLLLGLCKIVDLDLPALISTTAPDRDTVLEESLREVRKLRTVFRTAQVDPMRLRRSLRKSQPERRFELDESERLRRTPEAKRVFADAEHFAELSTGVVYPVHILYACLLAEDKHRDATLASLGIDKKRLLTVAKRQIGLPAPDATVGSTPPRTRWN
jgi:ATP-dependent Clp protease ATP-binding subunit ClpA